MKTKIVSLVLVVLAMVAAYVYWNNNTPSETAQQTGVATSTQPASQAEAYGMKKYTDARYGFTFWYPSPLTVTSNSAQNTTDFPGGTAVETLQIGPGGGTEIIVVDSPASTITDEPSGHASPIAATKYFYDKPSQHWMVAYPEGRETGASATTTADISKTTMSGLSMLPSGRRFDTRIIPLSLTRFIVVTDGGGSGITAQLAQTVTAAGASVDSSAQSNSLKAEAAAYANQH